MLHTKNQGSRPFDFRQEDFFMSPYISLRNNNVKALWFQTRRFFKSLYISLCKTCDPGAGPVRPQGHNVWVHDNSSKDTSSNTTFGRIRQLVECNVWSKWTVGRILFFVEMCLKFVLNWSKISNIYEEKNGSETTLF